jgi:cytochrome c oxidase subunit 4
MSSGHVLPLKVYLAVFGALMGLTAITTAVAYVDLGAANTAIALAIAGFKVVLVVLYFMHVRYSSRLVWVFALASAYWLLILFGFLMTDYVTRTPVPGWGA